jgi:hypothetical protein
MRLIKNMNGWITGESHENIDAMLEDHLIPQKCSKKQMKGEYTLG